MIIEKPGHPFPRKFDKIDTSLTKNLNFKLPVETVPGRGGGNDGCNDNDKIDESASSDRGNQCLRSDGATDNSKREHQESS